MQFSHNAQFVSAPFDDPSLMSAADLVSLRLLAAASALRELADELLRVPTDK